MFFDRFTDGARLAWAIANQMTGEYNHTHVLPEHLCYGIFSRPEARLVALCEAVGINPEQVKTAAKNALRSGSRNGPWGKQPLDAVTKQIFELAVNEADTFGHVEVNTTHILLALLKTPTKPCAEVLSDAGFSADVVHATIRRLFPPSPLKENAQLEEQAAAKHRKAVLEHEQRVERQRCEQLLRDQISGWQYAKVIRAFVDEVNRAASQRGVVIGAESELGLWLDWAVDHASKLDPIRRWFHPMPASCEG